MNVNQPDSKLMTALHIVFMGMILHIAPLQHSST